MMHVEYSRDGSEINENSSGFIREWMRSILKEPMLTVLDHIFEQQEENKERVARAFAKIEQSFFSRQIELDPSVEKILRQFEKKGDVETLEHSADVTHLAARAYECFEEELQEIHVGVRAFLYAAVLHDVGKLLIPDWIRRDSTPWRTTPDAGGRIRKGYREIFFEEMLPILRGETERDEKTCEEYRLLVERQLRRFGRWKEGMTWNQVEEYLTSAYDSLFFYLVPLDWLFFKRTRETGSFFLSESDVKKTLVPFEIDNLSGTTLMEVVDQHARVSEEMIRQMPLPLNVEEKDMVAFLAGHHHPEKRPPAEHQDQVEALHIPVAHAETLAEILQISDVYGALTQRRSYHSGYAPIEALSRMYKKCQAGEFRNQRMFAKYTWRMMEEILVSRPFASLSHEEQEQVETLSNFCQTFSPDIQKPQRMAA
ncbi:MAG: hypothetical protein UU48_C0006G0134 [Candidatus Uhrbacteria bacterium GW2011_GWF2_41_16]|uniref:HD/PDEase domain-containing protein n=2 Tax=Candidatus Uhriibacteriota TaxID=1752732 RepID=A0A0G0VB33_9BACT|nr:MAG: hypothetical protein UU35_C0009G0003 [Candidatus Uhrbacteria bacterium GW2011_GWC2_41_11]KKR98094.1 MAG: hypothetical protein UU48_C0006G0134 [Candidatus Uhrbacteria bacterium GW2011_GWF2_41_16]HBP00320.1 hypothetical protein [Candidatus Uhrbacteria bacterium]